MSQDCNMGNADTYKVALFDTPLHVVQRQQIEMLQQDVAELKAQVKALAQLEDEAN